MYSCCFGSINIETGEYNNLTLLRTYEEVNTYLDTLNKKAKKDDINFVLYVHNLSYEFSFFANNVNFIKNNIDNEKSLFIAQNKPLYVTCENLELRCSYLFLHKSIAEVGKCIDLPKLDYEYSKIRTPLTYLEKDEISYNYRDVEIMLKGVYDTFKKNPYMEKTEDIPFTKTGIMRFNCEKNPNINTVNEYIDKLTGKTKRSNAERLNKYLCGLEKAKNLNQLKFWEFLFKGGLVVSNPKYIGMVLSDLASFDLSSDYPFQMLYRKFPSGFEEYKGNKKIMIEKCLRGIDEYNLIYDKPLRTMFNAVVILNKVKAKFDFAPLGTSKIIEMERIRNMMNAIIINGKIHEINTPFKMAVTCVDMITLKLFYEFEIIEVEYLEVATRYKRTNQYKLNCIVDLAKKKIEFKKYVEMIEKKNKYHSYSKESISDEHFLKMINMEDDYLSQLSTAHKLYQDVKSDLNSLYGDNAQHLIHERFFYDTHTREWESLTETFSDYFDKQQKTSYIYGMYVPAYAQATILHIAYKFLKEGIEVFYIDTDSIKVTDSLKARSIVEEFNRLQEINIGEFKWTGFGQLENEYVAKKFSSLGTKSYIKLEKNKEGQEIVKATISGLPKASVLYNRLFKFYDNNFDEMIENTYHYGTVIDKSVSRKFCIKYQYDEFDISVDNYNETLISGAILEEVDVTMRDFNSKTWYAYARLICLLYGRDIDDFCRKTIIRENDKGELIINHEI